jgi:creatinine amidohydrolase
MLAIAPDRVRLDRATPGDTRGGAELLPLLRAGGVRSVSPTGILGDPTGAAADEGSRLIRAAAADLATMVAGLHRRSEMRGAGMGSEVTR